ncbi:uncharacterized protein N7459_004036 [Penicillium hispanicum]|uniref:uncharacterized protein n=1 Tax=Penicillium hispanicum TaxID=1080232 RepID=UPI00254127EE|nr:uncharacterized protein N7459_004036 [Penicillium hispanicum]KAJ5584236.1 hypothetical protein N7459_004036 [Penicillium hispanicum]
MANGSGCKHNPTTETLLFMAIMLAMDLVRMLDDRPDPTGPKLGCDIVGDGLHKRARHTLYDGWLELECSTTSRDRRKWSPGSSTVPDARSSVANEGEYGVTMSTSARAMRAH